MARAYFCNCLNEHMRFSLNVEKDVRDIGPAEISGDHTRNTLSMLGVDMVAKARRDVAEFLVEGVNVLTVYAPRGVVNRYDISIEAHLAHEDMYFFLFTHTMTGQTASGLTKGISIDMHEAVRRVLQDGSVLPGIQLLHNLPKPDPSEEN